MVGNGRTGSVFIGVTGFLGFSIIAGVLVGAMLTPIFAVASEATNASIGVFDTIPETIALGRLTQQNTVYAHRGDKSVPIATIFDQDRETVGWDDVSPYLKEAAIAGEDRRFYEHGGIDLQAVIRAAVANVRHEEIRSGASTIDMQLVRNILVQQALQIDDPAERATAYKAAIEDTIGRKISEMKLSIGLDKKYTKKQILLGYLNITGFGGQTYGVQAAAHRYFSVDAKDVTIAQAASLIAIVEDPNRLNLSDSKNFAANKDRRDYILRSMRDVDFISSAQYSTAVATPITTHLQKPSNGCLYATDAQFACDYVTRLIPTLQALGDTAEQREENWARGGYKLYTSIDLDQQDAAQAVLAKDAPADEARFALGAAADAVQPGTGRILVMAQNKKFNNSAKGGGPTATAVNFSTDENYGGSSGFATGSTYKIFTLEDWLQHDHGIYDQVNGSVRSFPMASFTASCEGPLSGIPYRPHNDSAYEGGWMSVEQATVNSVNVAFVAMTTKLDLCDIRADAEAMGVHRADGAELTAYPSSTLGTNEIAPLTMAEAIATIGADGIYCAPTIIDSVVDSDGTQLPGQKQDCSQAVDPKIAHTMAYVLDAVMTYGTGAPGNPHDGVPIVGKTGTTDHATQNWLIATTTKVALAVWVGNIDGGSQNVRHIQIAGRNGYLTKFDIFSTTMRSLDSDPAYRGVAFPAPDPAFMRRPAPPAPPPPPSTPTPPPTPGTHPTAPATPPVKGPPQGNPPGPGDEP